MRTTTMILTGAAAALMMSGCEQPTAAGSEMAEMQVDIQGDDSSHAPSGSGPMQSSADASAEIDVEARVYLRSGSDEWIAVTEGSARQTVDASGSDGLRVLATSEIAAGTYSHIRVEFERVEADVTGGLEIGTGLLTGSVRVEAGAGGPVVVERAVTIDARSGARAEVEINLNARQWLERADAESRTVAEAEFRNAVTIIAR
ncbi:MAG: hypothetical protein WD737_06320 [Gemmatimonadota bacterium]